MYTWSKRQPVIRVLGVSTLLILGFASLIATPPADAAAVSGVLPDAPVDSLLTLLPPRSPEVIQQDQSAAEAMESAANADLTSAQGILAEAKARVEILKSELDAIKTKVKLAKEQKNQTEQADLEQQAKAKELQLDVLKLRKELREAEVSLADARRQAAQARGGFFKKEAELVGKRGDLLKMSATQEAAPNPEGLIRLRDETRDLERRCLELLSDVSKKEMEMAKGEASVLDKRLELLQAQIAFLKGPKK